MTIYDIEVSKPNGEAYSLSEYKGKAMLIVNTATKCGLRDQFDGLEKLYEEYKEQGLVVLGFPSNQFKQEEATGEQAQEACRMTYGVTFPMHDLVKVNGTDAHPLFNYLTSNTKGFLTSDIKWNFTKFLVDQNGDIVSRFSPKDTPESFKKDVEKVLDRA
ncbi:glutathione peroxidase [Planococcus donghaensis MPA1U2]|uniref:Glutathione peroxidase n=1 Tax=Planococcus donghaensis MPA1U2 TaxID=933115 RepID=E7RCI0_9BACL|nr:glutathione peroxidase [Planococcus donghaensis]EGA91345.1 glutathione peroxidase [Planococcus donghaensis MPA1U2]